MAFQYDTYDNSHSTATIAQLLQLMAARQADSLRRRGQIAAQDKLARGQGRAEMIGSLGQAAAGTIASYLQEKQQAPIRAQQAEERAQISRARETQNRLNEQELLAPEIARQEKERLIAQDEQIAKILDADLSEANKLAAAYRVAGPRGTAAVKAWKEANEQQPLIQRDPTRDLVHPQTGAVVTPGVPEVKPPPAPTPFNLSPGQTRFGPDGKPVASLPPTPREPSQPSLQAKEVLDDDGKTVMANFDARTGSFTKRDGTPIKNPRPVPSAMEQMDSRKFEKARPIISSMNELSERINVLQGAYAKAVGEVEKQKAKINLNDDVAEYESVVAMFTPLVARALGHTGVLTEQDVASVKEGFPKPGDSKSLRDRKVARLEKIVAGLEGAEGTTPKANAPSTGGDWIDAGNGIRIRKKN